MILRAALALVGLTLAAPCLAEDGAPPPCPSISDQHRWLDDNSCLPDRSFPKRLRNGAFDLSLGGEARARIEATDALGFGFRDRRGEETLLLRGLLHADLHVGQVARGFVQLGFTGANGRQDGSTPIDASGVDIQQAFVELGAPLGGGRLSARAGRQELAFGSARLIGTREGPNLRLAFDGFRGTWRRGDLSIDAIATRPVMPGPGDFDDRRNRAQALYGIYVATAPPTGTGIDLYYLGYENDMARFDQGLGRERRHSLGARVFGARGGWSWDIEGVYQFGTFGPSDIDAWTVASVIGKTFERARWSPKVMLSANIASGDDDPDDGELNTFNALFPKLPYFNEASFGVPANFYDLRPGVTVSPLKTLKVEASADFFWRESARDAVYVTPLIPAVPGASSDARFIGTAYQLRGDWDVAGNVTLLAAFVHFDAGRFIRSAGGEDLNAFIGSVRWRW